MDGTPTVWSKAPTGERDGPDTEGLGEAGGMTCEGHGPGAAAMVSPSPRPDCPGGGQSSDSGSGLSDGEGGPGLTVS